MKNILFLLHCEENTGYAIVSLERVFLEAALRAGYSLGDIHFAYKKLDDKPSKSLPAEFSNKLELDINNPDPKQIAQLKKYIRNNSIDFVIAFDLGIENKLTKELKESGVKQVVAYWGGPMGSKNSGIKLLLKRIEVAMHRYKPNAYIFESEAMVKSAIYGRGIPKTAVDLLRLGVDVKKYRPDISKKYYAHDQFGISHDRRIVFYSGHMEERKGVAVIIRAAMELINSQGISNIHFILCGNRPGEADPYITMYQGTKSEQHITFAGYRDDIASLMSSSSIGVIASTGWDSFTMSSVEMAASGLPLIVSRLDGLTETVEAGITGYTFEVGNHILLGELILKIMDDSELHNKLSNAARLRAVKNHDREKQISVFANYINSKRP